MKKNNISRNFQNSVQFFIGIVIKNQNLDNTAEMEKVEIDNLSSFNPEKKSSELWNVSTHRIVSRLRPLPNVRDPLHCVTQNKHWNKGNENFCIDIKDLV